MQQNFAEGGNQWCPRLQRNDEMSRVCDELLPTSKGGDGDYERAEWEEAAPSDLLLCN